MAKKLTLEEKIHKILEYCDYVKDLARNNSCTVFFQVKIENAVEEVETERETAGSEYTVSAMNTSFLHNLINNAVKKAYQNSIDFSCLYTVKVWITTFKHGNLVDEEPVEDYEINFENGIEV